MNTLRRCEMRPWLKWVLIAVGIILVLICCAGVAGATYLFGTTKVAAEKPVAQVTEGPVVRETEQPVFVSPPTAAPTRDPLVEALATGQAQQVQGLSMIQTQLAQTEEPVVQNTPIPQPTPTLSAPIQPANSLVNPVLHHAESQPPENGVGSFDVGVKQGQIGLVFGWHIAWPKGNFDAGGDGCDLVILTPGWYENLQVQDGRYEVYDVPSSDYSGWIKVLGQQRADEQAKDYGCPTRTFDDIPQWESTIPSPP